MPEGREGADGVALTLPLPPRFGTWQLNKKKTLGMFCLATCIPEHLSEEVIDTTVRFWNIAANFTQMFWFLFFFPVRKM